MTLTDIYASCRKGGEDAAAAFAILDAQHWFCSLADFDSRSGEPRPRAMNRVLVEVAEGKAERTGPPMDRLWRICEHCGKALQSLYRTTNEEPFRVHELLHVRSVRELDVQSFVKLSMRPGNNIRQKLAGNPHLNAVRHTMTLDLPENRLLKACSEALESRLDDKASSVGLTAEEAELLERIKSWLHSDEAASISRWTDLPPNNTLLSHRDYRRIWDAWRQLGRLDEETSEDSAGMPEIGKGIQFWSRMVTIREIDGIGMAEIPLVFDSDKLVIHPFDDNAIPVIVPEVMRLPKTRNNGVARKNLPPKLRQHLIRYGGVLPETAQKPRRHVTPESPLTINTPVCIDLTSTLPVFSSDGKTASTLPYFLVCQRWTSSRSVDEFIDIGCYEADGVWNKKDVETIEPLDAFFQNDGRHSKSLDKAFRSMIDRLKGVNFKSEVLIWLVPDFVDDFSLGLARRSINVQFSKATPLPRSIAAVVAQVSYDSVKNGDGLLVIDQVGGVVFATKIEATFDKKLKIAVPETCGIRWTRHPAIVLRDERAKRDFDPDLQIVDSSGNWAYGKGSSVGITPDDVTNALGQFPECKRKLLADDPGKPLVCGGYSVFSLQQKAGDLSIWRDQLPALSMGGVIVDGMYGDFTLVDASSQSIRPVRGQAVSIPVTQLFNLPKLKAVFPLHQGEGRQSLDYVAEVDFPPQGEPTPCRLDLRYTYGADEPYSLTFIPAESGRGLPRRIQAKWKRTDLSSSFISSSYPSPSFPSMKSWQDLCNYPNKDGSGTRNLVDWVETALTSIDPVIAAVEKAEQINKQRRKRQQEHERRVEKYYENRCSGVIKPFIRVDRKGGHYFFAATDRGDVFCHETSLRHPDEVSLMSEGREVWFTRDVDRRTGKERGIDIAFDDALPNSLQKHPSNIDNPIQPNVLPVCDFISANEKRLRNNLFNVRFPMLTIMQGGRNLSDPTISDSLRRVVQRASEILDQCLSYSDVSDAFKSEALQVLSYLHAFAPTSFQHWALDVARNNSSLEDGEKWRKLAFCLGDMSQSWQVEISNTLLGRLTIPKDRRFVLGLLGIAAWRSSHFLDKIPPESIQRILSALQMELELGLKSNGSSWKRHPLYALSFELLLALQRVNQTTAKRYAPGLRPGTNQAAIFIDLLDQWTNLLHSRGRSLRFRVNVNASKKPKALYNTPDFLYALRCYLTGDDGANAISITSIDEGADSDDN